MILPILRWPDPRLSTPCAPCVLGKGLRALAADMLETMYDAPGRGLAAPQVGRMVRLFVMDVAWKDGPRDPVVMVNPAVLDRSDRLRSGPEGCLSIPGATPEVERADEVTMQWTDLDGALHRARLTGFAAICAQHEFDHLDGILTLDRLSSHDRARAVAGVTP